MNAQSNFHKVCTFHQLPQVPAEYKNINVDNEVEAQLYAERTGEQVYWIRTQHFAVRFRPLRRAGDFAGVTA